MQMAAFFNAKKAMIVVAKDPDCAVADWHVQPGHRLSIRFYGAVPEVEATAIEPTLEAAASVYRSWAARQPWATQERPRTTKLNFISVASSSSLDIEHEHLQRLWRWVSAPVGVWFTQWRRFEFDSLYPDYRAKEERPFSRLLTQLKRAGHRALPYVNGLLWDEKLSDFRSRGASSCVRTPDRSCVRYNARLSNLIYACPYDSSWREVIVAARESITDSEGEMSGGIYLDMLAAAAPLICWSDAHGHEPGDPHAWQRGIRALLAAVRGEIMVEGNAEAYLDLVDHMLMHLHGAKADAVPLWSAVYAGRVQSVGWPIASRASRSAIEAEVDRAGRFGVGGLGSPWMTPEPESELLRRDLGSLFQQRLREH